MKVKKLNTLKFKIQPAEVQCEGNDLTFSVQDVS